MRRGSGSDPGVNGHCAAGLPGVGKTHLAISLAVAAAESGRRVYCSTLAGLVESRQDAKAAGNPSRAGSGRPRLLSAEAVCPCVASLGQRSMSCSNCDSVRRERPSYGNPPGPTWISPEARESWGFVLLTTNSPAHPPPAPAPSSVPRRPVPYASLARRTYHRGVPAIAPNTTNAGSNPNWTMASKPC